MMKTKIESEQNLSLSSQNPIILGSNNLFKNSTTVFRAQRTNRKSKNVSAMKSDLSIIYKINVFGVSFNVQIVMI